MWFSSSGFSAGPPDSLRDDHVVWVCPLGLLQIFKMWNKELYVREQQDAYEFFTSLVDQLDEHLKVSLSHPRTHSP